MEMSTLMIPHSLFLLETEDGAEAIQDECQSPLAVARSTRDGAVHVVSAPTSQSLGSVEVGAWCRRGLDGT